MKKAKEVASNRQMERAYCSVLCSDLAKVVFIHEPICFVLSSLSECQQARAAVGANGRRNKQMCTWHTGECGEDVLSNLKNKNYLILW